MFRTLKMWAIGALAMLFSAMQAAHAAVPTEVTTSLTDLKADALVVATAVLVAIIAVFAFKFIRKGL